MNLYFCHQGNVEAVDASNRRMLHDKDDMWLGVAMDVSPSNDRMTVGSNSRTNNNTINCF